MFEVSLADLNKDEEQAFRKIKLRVDEVQGKNLLTNFHGMDFTSDKLRSLVKKWQVRLGVLNIYLNMRIILNKLIPNFIATYCISLSSKLTLT